MSASDIVTVHRINSRITLFGGLAPYSAKRRRLERGVQPGPGAYRLLDPKGKAPIYIGEVVPCAEALRRARRMLKPLRVTNILNRRELAKVRLVDVLEQLANTEPGKQVVWNGSLHGKVPGFTVPAEETIRILPEGKPIPASPAGLEKITAEFPAHYPKAANGFLRALGRIRSALHL